jgi:hypothetical protein
VGPSEGGRGEGEGPVSTLGWMSLFEIRSTGAGTVWLVCRRCGVHVTPVRSGYTLADLYDMTENHEHAQ